MSDPLFSFTGEMHASAAGQCLAGNDHAVQFYESSEYLLAMLRNFVRTGLETGESVIVVGSAPNLEALNAQFLKTWPEFSQHGPRYYPVNASEALPRVLHNGGINRDAFDALIGSTLADASRHGGPVRVFGELVALLVEKGCPGAAVDLEKLWNDLRERVPFTLLCAYPIQQFDSSDRSELFRMVCGTHSRVFPSETYLSRSGSSERLRAVAQLEQKARSFENEFTGRTQAEARCQDSENRVRQLMDLMPSGVYTCDRQGRITYFNRRAAELWGQSPEIGSDQQKFCGSYRLYTLDGSPLSIAGAPMVRAIQNGESTRDAEIIVERPDHTRIIASLNIDPIRDEDGRITGAINVFQDITARKQTELELRQKKEELTAFVENASLGLHWVGPDGIIKWANRAELEMLGYEKDEYIGRHIGEFHADQDVLGDILDRLASGEKLCGREARMRCKDGTIKYVAIDSSVLWDDGRFVHTQCFTRDITQQRKAEELSARLAAIVQSSEDAIFSLDLCGILTSWNKGAERIYGYSADEILGKHINTVIPLDEQGIDARIFEQLRRGERIDHYETRRRRKDGALISVSLTLSAIRDSSGAITGASKIARDITEQKRSQERQRLLFDLVARVNRAENLPEILDTALTAICRSCETERASVLLRDRDGVMRFKGWRGISAAYRSAVEGHSPWRGDETDPQPVLVTDLLDVPLDEKLKAVIAAEGIRALAFIPVTYEKRLLGKFMVYYAEPHQFKGEDVLSAQAISSQVAFAIERQKSGEQLEQLVRERTASLRDAIAQMEEFSYTVSHDLRAPLRGMLGYTEALLDDFSAQLPSEARGYLSKIKENATRLDKMILDVLTFSRLARTGIELEPVDLNALVRRIVEQYPGMQEPDVEIRIGPLCTVTGHEPSLTQAISNLLTNSVKFVAPGVKPKIEIRAEVRDAKSRIWFEDNGIGIEPKFQHRLFNMFERVHPKLKYDGTGVGLAIVRKAMERMGGKCGVESDGRNGSRFWIELPAAEECGS